MALVYACLLLCLLPITAAAACPHCCVLQERAASPLQNLFGGTRKVESLATQVCLSPPYLTSKAVGHAQVLRLHS
jgi:hypothetical protein